jgi:peptide/nickel transport system ATP-binding protein
MPHATPVLAASLEARGADAGDVLEIGDMSRTFKDGRKRLTAVNEVSLSLRRGETFGLVGESGSGKTTLARCVTGLIAPDTGTVTFEGKQLKATAGRRSQDALRAIQMVFQNPDSTLNPAWSTRAILTRAVRKLGSGGSVRAKVDKLSADVRVEPRFLMQKPTDLSGGQKQRIAIARAFAGDPTLVVCDEPASALDVSVQASILNLLVELQTKEQVSYVFISHDLAVVRYISDRIGVMYLAELIEVGSAEEVFNPPHHPYTEALLSSIPTLSFDEKRERIALRGTMPSLSEPPSGCRFHTRCHRILGDICVNQEPPVQEAVSGHTYQCHIPPDELLRLQTAAPADAPVTSSEA